MPTNELHFYVAPFPAGSALRDLTVTLDHLNKAAERKLSPRAADAIDGATETTAAAIASASSCIAEMAEQHLAGLLSGSSKPNTTGSGKAGSN